MVPPIDIATVVFDDELPLLEIQAHSIAKLMRGVNVGAYIVYINEKDPRRCLDFIEARVRPAIGEFPGRLVVKTVLDICSELPTDAWLSQQACKLSAASVSTSDFLLTLDAKHHAIRPVLPSDLFDSSNRPIKKHFEQPAEQQVWLRHSLAYFGAPKDVARTDSPASAPPFVLHAPTVRQMTKEITAREQTDLVSFFANKTDRTTEYTLYYAYLHRISRASELLANGPNGAYKSLRVTSKPEGIARMASAIASGKTWCFSIHRRRLSGLRDGDIQFITNAWRVLFPDDALERIRSLQAHFEGVKEQEVARIKLKLARKEATLAGN